MPTTLRDGHHAAGGLSCVAAAVVCALAQSFLTPQEARNLAAVTKRMLESMRAYRIPSAVSLDMALSRIELPTKCGESDSSSPTGATGRVHFLPAVRRPPRRCPGYLDLGADEMPDERKTNQDNLRWRIGQPTAVSLRAGDQALPQKLLRLRSVRALTLEYGVQLPPTTTPMPLPPGLTSLDLSSWNGAEPLAAFDLPATLRRIVLPFTELFLASRIPLVSFAMPLTHHTIRFTDDVRVEQPGLDRVVWPPALTELINAFDVIPLAEWSRLPEGLLILSFSQKFSQPVASNCLPDSITELTFGPAFNEPLESLRFPASLKRFTLGSTCYSHALASWRLPASCQELNLPAVVGLPDRAYRYGQLRLPDHIRSLTIQHGDQPWSDDIRAQAEPFFDLQLPASLTHLTIDANVSLGTMAWPSTLGPLKLTLGSRFILPLPEGHVPAQVTELDLGRSWNLPASELSLPSNLTSLAFSEYFLQSIAELDFPPSLTRLSIGQDVVASLRNARLPPSLRHLIVTYRRFDSHLPATPSCRGLESLERLDLCIRGGKVSTATSLATITCKERWRQLLPTTCTLRTLAIE